MSQPEASASARRAEFARGLQKLGLSLKSYCRITGADDRNMRRAMQEDGEGPSLLHLFALKSLLRNHIPFPAPDEGAKDSLRAMRLSVAKRITDISADAMRAGWSHADILSAIMDAAPLKLESAHEAAVRSRD